jgi:hypothetical protein
MEEDFTIEEVIEMMKKTKKTDPLFKPLKKLKSALEVGLSTIRTSVFKIFLLFEPKEFWYSISDLGIN